jgi:MEMO1 family protein
MIKTSRHPPVFFHKVFIYPFLISGVLLMVTHSFAGENSRVRKPAVAGQFYSDNPSELKKDIVSYIAKGKRLAWPAVMLISPHAGYVFSGPVAGIGYAAVDKKVSTVILLGPPHHVPVRGIATPGADWFETPLGKVQVDQDRIKKLLQSPLAYEDARAHAPEHSVEVQIPFLQVHLSSFKIVPLLVHDIDPRKAADLIYPLIDEGTVVIASSDFSHYKSQKEARAVDDRSIAAILAGNDDGPIDACGELPIRVVMNLAKKMSLSPVLLDARTSFNTAPQYGPGDRVVGYASIAYVRTGGGRKK